MATRKTADVVVAGGGIFGLSCAWACARRGLQVVLVERGRIAGGASGGIVGALSPHTPDRWNPKKQFQFEALVSAEAHWREVERVSGRSCGYGRVGRLLPLVTEKARVLAEERAEGAATFWNAAATFWNAAATWRVVAAGPYASWISPRAAPFGVIHETLSARLAPRLACAALSEALRRRGAQILENWPVEAFGDGAVSGPEGEIAAQAVILACGVDGFAAIGPEAGRGEKGQAALLDPLARPGRRPTIFHDGLYVVPQADGKVAVGSTSERTWQTEGTDAQLEAVLTRARAFCPALHEARICERWSGIRPRPRQRDPMLGPLPGHARVLVANGAFKIGFGIAHKVGEALADMIEGHDPNLPDSFTVTHHLAGSVTHS